MFKISMEEIAMYKDEMNKMDNCTDDELDRIIYNGRNNVLLDSTDQFRFAYALIKKDFLDEVYSLYYYWLSKFELKTDKKGDNIYYDYIQQDCFDPNRYNIIRTDPDGDGGGPDCPDGCNFVALIACLVLCVGCGMSGLGEKFGWTVCENCGDSIQDGFKYLCCKLPWNCCVSGLEWICGGLTESCC